MARDVHTILPLIDIHSSEFARSYELGLWWSLFGEREEAGPLDDRYLVDNLKIYAEKGCFDGQHDQTLFTSIGFSIGMIHGGVLSPQAGTLLPDVTTLVTICDKYIRSGYRAGREWFFNEAEPHEQRPTDTGFIERLKESITDMLTFHDSDETWNNSIGCVLGELSGQLFPQTQQEGLHWKETTRPVEAHLKRDQESQERTTQPLPILEALQEA